MLRRLGLALSSLLFVAVFIAAFPSCKTVDTGTGGPATVAVSAVVDCAKGAAHKTSLTIIDDVGTAIATRDWEAELLDLAKRFGGDALACALSKIRLDSEHVFAMNGDVIEDKKATRAKQWLNDRKVVFASYSTPDGGL